MTMPRHRRDEPLATGQALNPGAGLTRRTLLGSGAVALAWAWLVRTPPATAAPGGTGPAAVLGFAPVAATRADTVTLPPGYAQRVVFAWGDPVVAGAPAWDPSARQDAAAQALQAGTHHDGMELFEVRDAAGARRWLLAVNHEFVDQDLLHGDPHLPLVERARKGMQAVGVSVIEVRPRGDGSWEQVPGSPYGRRVTATTPMRIAGPAAGSPLLATREDPQARRVRGTLGNCAAGRTPWGTYLTCEENFPYWFVRTRGEATAAERAYGITAEGRGYGWHHADPRYDAAEEPREAARFGWVVEIDPADPASTPAKHTALGRLKHENACVVARPGQPLVAYMGDDERFQHLYKFVSEGRLAADGQGPRDLLERGTLYVARLDADGTGRWLPLVQGQPGLTAAEGFASQAEVLVHARLAARAVGATPMDRPEWMAVHPGSGRVVVALTYNEKRGLPGAPGADAANPVAPNLYGHVLGLEEQDGDAAAQAFRHEVVLRCGPEARAEGAPAGTPAVALGAPDGLHVDARGVLWIQTDAPGRVLAGPAGAGFPNNQVVALDPVTRELRRFLVGPRGCEITGLFVTADLRTLFVNVMHPGEPEDGESAWTSHWPASDGTSRPRSATVCIWRPDGQPIGS